MSQRIEKEFANAGVQSPSEFEVVSDESFIKLVSRQTTDEVSPKSRVDSIVQTQDSACEFKPLVKSNQKTLVNAVESSDHHGKKKSENLNRKSVKTTKKSNKKGMDNNPLDSDSKLLTSDLERKKLEAELKATEQIAKIRQSVIEKRLQLELASLQDPCNPNIGSLQQSPNYDFRVLENLAEQREPTYRNPLQPPFVPSDHPPSSFGQCAQSSFQPQFPFPISSPNQNLKDPLKNKSSKNESDFLIRNEIKGLRLSPLTTGSPEMKNHRSGERSLRHIVLPERGKFMQTIQKPTYCSPQSQMGTNPFKTPMEEPKYVQMPQRSVTEAYYSDRMPERNVQLQQDMQQPGCSPGMAAADSISIWKIMMSKVKKKLRKKTPPLQ